jgi:hypothetical protein
MNPSEQPEGQLYLYPKTELLIDNGIDFISIDRGVVAEELSRCGLSEESIMKLLSAVNTYADLVKSELPKGIHVGPTDLDAGVGSCFSGDPSFFGLQTSTELQLAIELIEKACVKRKKFELGQVEQGE